MKLKQKLLLTLGLASVVSLAGPILTPVTAHADSSCGVETAIIHCPDKVDNESNKIEKNGVWALLLIVLNILTAGIGIVAIGGIVYGSILYASAGDKADQIKKASGVITNVIVGLIGYALLFSLVQYLIPGGVFN